MAFTTGQVLTAAQLNDLDNDSVTTDQATIVDADVSGTLTIESATPRILFVDSGETAGDEFDIIAHETGPSWSVRATTDNWSTDIKRIEIDSWEGPTYLRVNNGSGSALVALTLEHATGNVQTGNQFQAATGTGSASAPTYSFEDDPDSGIFLAGAADLRACLAGGSVTRWNTSYFGPVTAAGTYNNGASGARWGTYYGTNADDISSDMRLKDRTGDPLGLDFVNKLEPFAGRWKDPDKGTREHQWLSAQNVAEVLEGVGVDPADSALWTEDGDTGEQSLAYTELVPVLINAVKELTARVAELENR